MCSYVQDRRYCGQGESNGRLNGVRHFHCNDNCGCFVNWQDLYLSSCFDDASDNQSTINPRWAISTETLLSCLSEDDNNCEPKQDNSTVVNSLDERPQHTRELCVIESGNPELATTLDSSEREWWEIPKGNIHISSEVVTTAEWGYISNGILCGQKVAVKRFHKDIISQLTVNRVLREIGSAAQIHHPNLLLFIGAIIDRDNGPCIVTEILDQTLKSANEDKLLTEHSKLLILRDVALALNYLHSHRLKIAHGAVDSSNILLEALRNDTWKAKLSDFALVRWIHPTKGETTKQRPTVSKIDLIPDAQFQEVVSPEKDICCFGHLVFKIVFNVMPVDSAAGDFVRVPPLQGNPHPQMYKLAENCTKQLSRERLTMKEILMIIDDIILL